MSSQKNNNTGIKLAIECKCCESEDTESQNRMEKEMDSRSEKIARIKNAIQTGTYQVSGKEVAKQILKKAKKNRIWQFLLKKIHRL